MKTPTITMRRKSDGAIRKLDQAEVKANPDKYADWEDAAAPKAEEPPAKKSAKADKAPKAKPAPKAEEPPAE